MIDISKGKYWDLPWSLVSSCTRCSPGCTNCWSLAMEKRFHKGIEGQIITHPERLSIPLKRRKPTVYAVWNDLFHEAVSDEFIDRALSVTVAPECAKHTFLILTKRPAIMAHFYSQESLRRGKIAGWFKGNHSKCFHEPDSYFLQTWPIPNVYHGLTVCNQPEWKDKKDDFLSVPGLKFISHEPGLERIDYGPHLKEIDCMISGGETGSGARPSHPDIFRADRDQCAEAGVAFFFKGFGDGRRDDWRRKCSKNEWNQAKRLLDGRTHDDLPWRLT